MKYQPGDEILVLLSNETGKVVEIINDEMVMIEVRGVKFPAYMDQIDFPYFKRFTEKKRVSEKAPPKIYIDQVPREKSVPNQLPTPEGMWLSTWPRFVFDEFDDEVIENLKIYLVNKTADRFNFQYKQMAQGEEEFILQSEIGPFQDFYVHDMPFERVNDAPTFWIDFTLQPPNKKRAAHFEVQVKWKPKTIFKKMEELKEQNQPAALFPLFSVYPDFLPEPSTDFTPLQRRGFKIYDAARIKENLPPARTVIDLHIEKITNHWQEMSADEILHCQLSELDHWVEIAIAHRLDSMVIVHGVGAGVLRKAVHERLNHRKEVRSIVHQYEPAYGDGASRVYFKS